MQQLVYAAASWLTVCCVQVSAACVLGITTQSKLQHLESITSGISLFDVVGDPLVAAVVPHASKSSPFLTDCFLFLAVSLSLALSVCPSVVACHDNLTLLLPLGVSGAGCSLSSH